MSVICPVGWPVCCGAWQVACCALEYICALDCAFDIDGEAGDGLRGRWPREGRTSRAANIKSLEPGNLSPMAAVSVQGGRLPASMPHNPMALCALGGPGNWTPEFPYQLPHCVLGKMSARRSLAYCLGAWPLVSLQFRFLLLCFSAVQSWTRCSYALFRINFLICKLGGGPQGSSAMGI